MGNRKNWNTLVQASKKTYMYPPTEKTKLVRERYESNF
jgi:hypothetical protein